MAVMNGTVINSSPTVVFPANAAITGAQCKAVKLNASGKVVLAGAGEAALGIIVISDDENIAAGQDVNIQVKDIGMWEAGAAVKAGDLLACDANGKAVKATASSYIMGVALTSATSAGTRVRVQITKSGYVFSGSVLPIGG